MRTCCLCSRWRLESTDPVTMGGGTSLISVPVRASANPVIVGELEDWTDGCQCVVLVINKFRSCGLEFRCCDAVYACEDLRVGHATAIVQHLLSDIVSGAGEAVLLHHQLGLQVSLSSIHLPI